MSKLTDSLISGAEQIGGGILSSLIGGAFSKNASRDMMRYQDAINDQNAIDAYNRQRYLMMEAPSLQKEGMRKAGYNTAFGSNGSVQSVGTQPVTNVGLGSVDTNKMPTSVQTLLDAKNAESSAKVADAQSAFLRSQQQGQDIKNSFEIQRQIEEVEQLHKQNKISDADYQTRMEQLRRALDTHDAYVTEQTEQAKQAEIQTKVAEIQRQQEVVKTEILQVTKQLNNI